MKMKMFSIKTNLYIEIVTVAKPCLILKGGHNQNVI